MAATVRRRDVVLLPNGERRTVKQSTAVPTAAGGLTVRIQFLEGGHLTTAAGDWIAVHEEEQ